MVKRPAPTSNLDLFRDYEPAPVVARFEREEVQAWSPAGRLSKAVATTLADSGRTRDEIAEAMSLICKKKVSRATLDAYAAQGKEDHEISALRLMALVQVTKDVRPLNELLADIGLIVVPQKYEALMRREQARMMRERMEREEQAADAEWRAKS